MEYEVKRRVGAVVALAGLLLLVSGGCPLVDVGAYYFVFPREDFWGVLRR